MNIVYTRSEPFCPWCERVKGLLQSYNIPYEEIDINGEGATGFWALDFRSVPQVFLNNKHIGGFEATAAYLRGNK